MSNFILTDDCYKCRGGIHASTPRPLNRLTCARDDTAAFQVLLDNGGKRCILNPGASPALTYETHLTRYRVEVVSRFSARVYAEGYLEDESGIPCADILHETPVTYEGGLYAPAYVTLFVPTDTPAGDYPVEVNVYCCCGARDESRAASLPLTLHVSGFVMPAPDTYRCHLDLWQHNSNIARAYGVELWSDAHFSKIEQAVAALAQLGQKSVTVLAGDCPWRGWGCYLLKDHPATLFEYSMVRIAKDRTGAFRYDFDVLRRYIELCRSYGITGDITVYGIAGIWTNMPLFPGAAPEDYPEKLLIRYLDEADGCYRYLRRSEDITAYLRALFSFFEAAGWFESVRIGADEPADLGAYEKNYGQLKSIAPNLRFKMALDKSEAIERFAERTEDIAASFPCSCKNGKLLRELKKRHPEKRLLWYVCNIPDRPNSVLRSELTELRALGPIGYLFGFDGFLRWAFTCWPERPLEDIRYNNTSLPAGDVNFVYPAKNGALLYSLRYFALKKTLQDYELLHLLCDRGKSAEADRAVKTVLRDTNTETYMTDDFHTRGGIYSDNYDDYETFRSTLFELLEKE